MNKNLLFGIYLLISFTLLATSRFSHSIWGAMVNLSGGILSIVKGISQIGSSFKENQHLRTEIKKLEAKIMEHALCPRSSFAEVSDFLIPCDVVGKDPVNWYSTIVIKGGRNHQIKPLMPVIAYKNGVPCLVGRIKKVGNLFSAVSLLTDPSFRVGIIFKESKFYGVLQGTGTKHCLVKYVAVDAILKEGEPVVTSGFGGMFPRNIYVGKVISWKKEKNGLFLKVKVAPMLDIRLLDHVFVVKYLPNPEIKNLLGPELPL